MIHAVQRTFTSLRCDIIHVCGQCVLVPEGQLPVRTSVSARTVRIEFLHKGIRIKKKNHKTTSHEAAALHFGSHGVSAL